MLANRKDHICFAIKWAIYKFLQLQNNVEPRVRIDMCTLLCWIHSFTSCIKRKLISNRKCAFPFIAFSLCLCVYVPKYYSLYKEVIFVAVTWILFSWTSNVPYKLDPYKSLHTYRLYDFFMLFLNVFFFSFLFCVWIFYVSTYLFRLSLCCIHIN